jgi:hypothetical protein
MTLRTYDEVVVEVAGVDGWMSADQARRLYDAAARTASGDQIVEIGSFRGRSTIVLASAAPEGVAVVAIDPHAGNDRGPQEIEGFAEAAADDHEVFNANLAAAGVAHRVRHIRAFSDAAHHEVQGDLAVLYVDGAHRYAPTSATGVPGWSRVARCSSTTRSRRWESRWPSAGRWCSAAASATWVGPARWPSTAPTSPRAWAPE